MAESVRVSHPSMGVARVTLARPERHNAFDAEMIERLTRVLAELDADDAVSIVVLDGEGRSFCAGADLGWMREAATRDRAGNIADAQALARLMATLDGLRKTSLALVHGAAYGGGFGLVACCDIAIAAEEARFGLTEARLGLIPAVISPYVIDAIGSRQARRLFQTAETFPAAEAERIGLVHEVVAGERLASRGEEIVALLTAAAPGARAQAKRLVAAVKDHPRDEALLALTAEWIATIREGPEAAEGMAAFFERRPASWRREG
ncbi:enoyl-CoA hydratase-related protein [Ancylobacter sp. MQZ15Z-1]|uniref:Enoyl-CoA hydratase-related protein n=1 Tax=Ancylobacter mangrovi TaxID=2972472 RepID=A0A9X2PMK3_9HYPH|nr:enoyl-CoA hydratase-related protein [Ancylobacter mangrovi]MCS0496543.1 enoyl-CoA hydratase-related protein [Ancylobacter mangrovi]